MTDTRSTIAGNYPGGIRLTCILNEGAPTVVTSYDQQGRTQKTLTFAAGLAENDIVAIANDSDCTFVACGGVPCVETPANGETLVVGQIVSTPEINRFPANDAAANDLSERLAGGYYRTAIVEFWPFIKVIKADIMVDGSNACVPGVGATLKYNITSGSANHKLSFDSAANSGVGVVPLHYVAAGSDGDTATALVGITGLMLAVTGA